MMLLADLQRVLLLQDDVLAELETILQENSEDGPWTPYRNLQLSAGAFGSSDKGGSLGWHHTRAHQVVADTIREMIVDLRGFAEGVRMAAEAATTADDSAAADLTKRAEAVHYGDQNAYHHARNEQEVVPADPTPSEIGDGNGGTP